METYYGVRRLSEKERQAIRSGSVFVWDEREAGMRRWTDGKSWSASRVSGSFLTYREMEGKRGNAFGGSRRGAGKTPDSGRGSDDDHDDGEPDGYRYKPDGLTKQSFSITNSAGQHLHLIAYYSRGPLDLPQPSNDSALRHIVPAKGMYPESSLTESAPPATTRAPMHQPHYPPHHHQPPPHHGYPPQYPHPGYAWPPSPIGTPPYGHGHYPYSQGPPPPGAHAYPPHPHHPYAPAPNPPYDRAPLPLPAPHPHSLPQLPTPLPPPKTGMPLPQPFSQNQRHSPQIPPPRLSLLDSPRSQQLQLAAREAVQIEPRLAPIDAARNQHSPLPVPGQLAQQQQQNGASPPPPIPLPPATNGAATSPTAKALSASPPRSAISDNLATPTASTKPSLSALLLHPPPAAGSEPNSANPTSAGGTVNSAGSSPRGGHQPNGLGGRADGRLPGEDARAIGVLNKNFF
ncbi:hypothetical protein NEMBOFW57_003871 [Staphylotrichum longicolle]|uniref:cAMP-independent regulatory protein pac2 n=1 Tax=Staphylotrichum longicolle TaxID=669026 RepID=A0AAD4F6W2_9PEZI|nr:hypothetical protein NEMBOFW57_003871 [Staphylotrichum longicolle]